MIEPIKIDGLREFQRNLGKIDKDLPKALRIALNKAADIIVTEAAPMVPRRTGRAAASIKPRSTRSAVRVGGGGNRAPYYPWLDFGGRVGRNRSVRRPFLKQGRYIFKAYADKQASGEFVDVLQRALLDVIAEAGVAVD